MKISDQDHKVIAFVVVVGRRDVDSVETLECTRKMLVAQSRFNSNHNSRTPALKQSLVTAMEIHYRVPLGVTFN